MVEGGRERGCGEEKSERRGVNNEGKEGERVGMMNGMREKKQRKGNRMKTVSE